MLGQKWYIEIFAKGVEKEVVILLIEGNDTIYGKRVKYWERSYLWIEWGGRLLVYYCEIIMKEEVMYHLFEITCKSMQSIKDKK